MKTPFTDSSALLAIESSCDETSAAVYRGDELLSNVISSQLVHERYGGVIPELASRAHIRNVVTVVREAMELSGIATNALEAVAVTSRPGLIGALVVGANFAKGLALRHDIPIVPVSHLEGHIFSAFVEHPSLRFPFLALVASGGHTGLFFARSFQDYELVGSTRDDAAGEAFDKIAKLLGLGYPGGARIDALAREGNPRAIAFPRGMIREPNFDFSFSGLKTAVRTYVQKTLGGGASGERLADVCASAQEAIAEVLTVKTIRASEAYGARAIVMAGGVAANSRLRAMMLHETRKRDIGFFVPSAALCADNAAMIGCVARQKLLATAGEPNAFRQFDFTVSSAALRAKRK